MYKQGNTRGTGEVRRGTSSIHIHCPVPRLSSHIGHGAITVLDLVARAIRNAIRANRFARIIRNWNPYFYSASGRFARITRMSDSRESPDSRESCESIRANHATKRFTELRPPKSGVSKRGWRTKGVGANPSHARDYEVFSVPSFLCPFRRRVTQFWGPILPYILVPVSRQPPPANPFSKPLTKAAKPRNADHKAIKAIATYTPARNCCDINSENIISCNWNEFFQEKYS